MRKKMTIMLISVGILFGLIFGWWGFKQIMIARFIAGMGNKPQTVATSIANKRNWQPYLNSIGTLTAINGVDVTTQLNGIVTGIFFNSGENVKAGDLLVKLDTSVEEGDLQNYTADMHLGQIDLTRQTLLYKTKAVAKSVLDASTAKLEEAQANVNKTNAQIALKTIRAPFSGKLGIRQINLGQYIAAGNPLVTLQSLDPLYADFSVPEQFLPELYIGQSVEIQADTISKHKIYMGKIESISSKVDPNTRNVQIRAILPNQKAVLLPGMSISVNILLKQLSSVIVIPETAITFSLYGDSVYLVVKGKGPDGKERLQIEQKFVTVGERRGNAAVILKGLNPGDQVVVAGQLKIDSGTPVTINNSVVL